MTKGKASQPKLTNNTVESTSPAPKKSRTRKQPATSVKGPESASPSIENASAVSAPLPSDLSSSVFPTSTSSDITANEHPEATPPTNDVQYTGTGPTSTTAPPSSTISDQSGIGKRTGKRQTGTAKRTRKDLQYMQAPPVEPAPQRPCEHPGLCCDHSMLQLSQLAPPVQSKSGRLYDQTQQNQPQQQFMHPTESQVPPQVQFAMSGQNFDVQMQHQGIPRHQTSAGQYAPQFPQQAENSNEHQNTHPRAIARRMRVNVEPEQILNGEMQQEEVIEAEMIQGLQMYDIPEDQLSNPEETNDWEPVIENPMEPELAIGQPQQVGSTLEAAFDFIIQTGCAMNPPAAQRLADEFGGTMKEMSRKYHRYSYEKRRTNFFNEYFAIFSESSSVSASIREAEATVQFIHSEVMKIENDHRMVIDALDAENYDPNLHALLDFGYQPEVIQCLRSYYKLPLLREGLFTEPAPIKEFVKEEVLSDMNYQAQEVYDEDVLIEEEVEEEEVGSYSHMNDYYEQDLGSPPPVLTPHLSPSHHFFENDSEADEPFEDIGEPVVVPCNSEPVFSRSQIKKHRKRPANVEEPRPCDYVHKKPTTPPYCQYADRSKVQCDPVRVDVRKAIDEHRDLAYEPRVWNKETVRAFVDHFFIARDAELAEKLTDEEFNGAKFAYFCKGDGSKKMEIKHDYCSHEMAIIQMRLDIFQSQLIEKNLHA